MEILNETDITFAAQDVIDKEGRVFFWKGGVYRAIAKPNAALYKDLLSNAEFGLLFNRGLIDTSIADLELKGYDLILKHYRIPIISYVTEWSGSMIKDAALLTLDINMALLAFNLQIKDAHPWNVLFEGCKAVYIDFSSIIQKRHTRKWFPLQEFWGKFHLPLLLMSYGCPNEARSLLVDPLTLRGRNLTQLDIYKVLIKRGKWKEVLKFLIEFKPGHNSKPLVMLEKLRRRVEKVRLSPEKTRWSDYCDEEVDFTSYESWMIKRKETYQVLKRVQPKTVLDIGSNTGWFSKLAALGGSKVIAFDIDEPSINKLFNNQNAKILSILPLSMDFRKPTPAYGLGLRCQPAEARLKAELVLALAIVHHLVFTQKERFETIIGNLHKYSEKWLLVEFIPKEDIHVSKMYNDTFSWYTLENFISGLKKYYKEVEVLPSNPAPRVLLLCSK